jgi:hypothetical protein
MFLKLDEATTRPLLMPHMRLPRPAVMNGVYDGPVVASAGQLGRSSNRALVIRFLSTKNVANSARASTVTRAITRRTKRR